MNRFARRLQAGQWVLVALMVVMAAVMWSVLPDSLPVHWNLAGQVNRYGGKAEGLLVLPAVALALAVLLRLLPRVDPFHSRYREFATPYALIGFAIIAFFTALFGFMLMSAAGVPISIGLVLGPLVGVLLMVIGAVLPGLRRNWFMGVRTPWTLSSERSWTATHRAARWVFVLMGLSVAAAGLLQAPWTLYLAMGVCLAGILGLVAYSYLVWRTDPTVRGGVA